MPGLLNILKSLFIIFNTEKLNLNNQDFHMNRPCYGWIYIKYMPPKLLMVDDFPQF